MLQETVLAKYRVERVPRYTSYPTSPHFTEAMPDEDYRARLAAVPAEARVSLYLHIPFCRELCWYCGCHTRVTRGDRAIEAYLDALQLEIERVRQSLPGRLKAGHLHFGGGTPTILTPQQFIGLNQRLAESFDIAEDAEIAVEIDPRRLSAGMIEALALGGVNRVSIGVQSFDPKVQRAINRHQSFEQTAAVCQALRGQGIGRINLDLIYGLPYQTQSSCEETLALSLALRPDRLSVFGYAHLPSLMKHQRLIDENALPNAEERLAQFETIAAGLEAAGYRRIGLDHFALPQDELARRQAEGRLRRNFQGYTSDDCDLLLGFGASAVSMLPDCYIQNDSAIPAYRKRIEGGGFAVARSKTLDRDDRLRREVIERLMCDYQVDLGAALRKHGMASDGFEAESLRLSQLAGDGLIDYDGARVCVRPPARPLVRSVAAVFDRYLAKGSGRHAAAV
jgi:oxygen-independent coproporphyrinogen-3 oxidase